MYSHVLVPGPSDSNVDVLTNAFKVAMCAPNPHTAASELLALLGEAFHAKRAYIYEIAPEGREYICTTEWCAPHVRSMIEVTHGLTASMASRWFGDGERRSLLAIRNVEDVAKVNPAYASLFAPRGIHSQVVGKLLRGTSPMGVLGFDDPDPELFDQLCDLMYIICAFATSVINTRNLLKRMRSVGMVDKLTGAGTRMSFYHKAENIPPNVSAGMAFLDIVGLQGINDVRGHDAGDELIVAVRQILITEFNDSQVFRMGGDEFVVFAQGIPEAPFRAAMDRVKNRLKELSAFVAMGVGWQQELGSDYDTLLREAWLACTKAKQEWERRGGKRLLAEDIGNPFAHLGRQERHDDAVGRVDLACYRGEEFYRRAHIWACHLKEKRFAMLAFDINYFKLYNDIFGREAGDMLLQNYAEGITKMVTTRYGLAGYFGGDDFAALIPLQDNFDENTIVSILDVELGKYNVAKGFAMSVGAVITADQDVGMTILYDRALVALQEVRGSYTRHYSFYDESRFERERENQLLLIQAQESLARGEFTFYLQPKVDIRTNKVVSAEALVRWIHNGDVVPPYEFVGLMERSGYIFALDRYVWESVCRWQRSLMDRGIQPVPISVNVSRVDFYFADLADHFKALVERYDISPRLVGVEVTESAYTKDAGLITDVIHRLQREGFLVFMDDFGSGYSSLNMLRSVAVDVLKMDKGFIDNADIHDGSDAIIANVINMAHLMGLPVISEGVETKAQRDSLRSMGCDYVQGYYYYKPMPIDEFENLLRSGDSVELDHCDNIILAM